MKRLVTIVATLLALTHVAGSSANSSRDQGRNSLPSHNEHAAKQTGKTHQDHGRNKDDRHDPRNCNDPRHDHGKPKPPKPPEDRATTPAAPTQLIAEAVTEFQVNLMWVDTSTNELGFKVERSLDGTNYTQIAQVLPNTTIYRDLNRFPDTKYFYRARAFNAQGNSVYSTVARVQTPAAECNLSIVGWGEIYSAAVSLESARFTAIAAGSNHELALKADGTVVGWGNYSGNSALTPPTNLLDVVAIAVGTTHSLALRRQGTVVGWGVTYSSAENPPANLTGVVAISAGNNHSLALKSDGTVVGWGDATFGATLAPTNLAGIVAIAAGGNHSLALKSDGTVVGWGFNDYGQTTPPTNLSDVVAIAAGEYHSLALKQNGTVVGWGGQTTDPVSTPTNLLGVIAIAAGNESSVALKQDGTVVHWGRDPYGSWSSTIQLRGVAAIASGGSQFLALTTTPNPPTYLGTKVIATNLINLSWFDNSAGRHGFRIERALAVGEYDLGEWRELGTVGPSVTNFNDATVATNAAYWYRLFAFNDCDVSQWSSSWERVRVAPPTQVPYLSASAFADQIRLDGGAHSEGVTRYLLERAPDVEGNPGVWAELLTINLTSPDFWFSHTDAGLPVNTTFWYRLRSFNGLGASPYSDPVSATIVPPRPPHYLSARIGASNQVNLVWYLSYPNDQHGFRVERSTDLPGANETWTEIATVTNNPYAGAYTDRAVTTNTTYRYRIRAFNMLGVSLPSAEASIHIVAPGAPVLGATPFANTIKLNWYNPDYPGDIEQFELERAADVRGRPGTWTRIATIQNPNNHYHQEYTNGGLMPDTTYWFRLRASNWVGTSPYSTPISVTIVPPRPPSYFLLTIGASNLVNLAWTVAQPADQDGFRIERAPDTGSGPGAWSEIGVTLTNATWTALFSDSNAAPHRIYWYRVRSFNAAGISDYSSHVGFAVVPPARPLFSAWQDVDRVELNFQGPEPGVLGFKVDRAPDAGGMPGAWTQIATIPPVGNHSSYSYGSFTDSNRLALATYWYRVRAFNWVGDSEASAVRSVMILPPPAPAYLSAQIGNTNQVELSWLAVGAISGYRIERALNTGGVPGAWVELPNLTSTNNSNGGFIDLLTRATDSDIQRGNSYSYRIRAFNVVGYSDYSAAVRVDIVPPPAPVAYEASVFADQITLTWSGDYSSYGSVAGHEIERAHDVGGIPGSWMKIDETNAGNDRFTDMGLTAGTYWYRVNAYNWVGASSNSAPLHATIAPPRSPYFLSGRIGTNHSVDLSWTAGDYPPSQSGFIVERTADTNGNAVWLENGNFAARGLYWVSYADTNATALTTNWYRVRAYNNVGVSTNSLPLEMRIVPPVAPAYLEASPFADQVKLTWYVSYGEAYGHVDGFKIERAPDVNGDPGSWTQVGTARYTSAYCSYTDTNRPVNTAWWYRVRAYNWVGDSPYGNTVRTTIVPPTAPTSLNVWLGLTNRVELSWYAGWPYDQDGFYLERAPASGGASGTWSQIATLFITNAYGSFTDTNITANTTNWYRVRAFSVTGISPFNTPVSIAIVPPAPPLNLAGYPDANRVELSWNQWTGGDTLGFHLERAIDIAGSPEAWTRIATLNGTAYGRYTDPGLTAGTRYWYRVQAFNWVGPSPFCDSISVTIVPPLVPDYLYATIQNTNMLRLNWSYPYGNAFDVDGYRIERAPDAGGLPGTWTLIATNADHTRYGYYDDTNVTANTTNWYRVRSYNIVGISEPSVPLQVRVIPPAPPQSVTASPFADQIHLSWYGYYYNYGWIQGFEIERAENVAGQPGVWSVIGRSDYGNQYTDPGLPAGATYWYRVRAYNWIGAGEFSAPVSGTIVPPPAPYSLTALIGPTNIVEVKWAGAAPGNQAGYFLERAPDSGGIPGVWSQITVISNFSGYYLDTNITAFTTNWYRVRAYNVVGVSPYTSPIQIAITPPPSPGYIQTTPFANQVRLSWGSFFYYYGQVAGYKLERAPDAGGVPGAWTQIATKPSVSLTDYTDPDLPANATFWYRVCAYNWIGAGQWTTPAKVTITAPAAPNNAFAALGTTNTIALTWYAGYPYDQDYFKVEWTADPNSTSGGWTEIGIVPATNNIHASFNHTNVLAYTTNWYRLRAVNGVGISSASATVSASTLPPPVPSYLTAYPYQNRITLYWPSYSTYGIIGNKIDRAPDLGGVPGTWTQIANLPSYYGTYDDVGLTNNGTYWYRVHTYNWIGASPLTAPASATISWFAALTPSTFVAPAPGGLQITSLLLTNYDALITWSTFGNTTNVVEATTKLDAAFSEVSPQIIISDRGPTVTNYLDVGAGTNSASRFYRIKLVK
jgi:alpha-tubulin suppressor-like RCC1 family protein/predicted phage tail protein